MRTPRPRAGRPRWLRLPRRTARLRLTVRYGGAVFVACGATVLAVTYLLYGQLGNAPHLVIHHLLHKGGKVIPFAAVQPPAVTIRMTGLGQLSLDRQQLLIAAGIALAVIAVAAAAIGWVIAGQVLRPLRTITAAARRISASSLHERLPCTDPTTSSRNSPTPSTACSRGWRPPSTRSGGSPPTPPTSCAPR
ncbi:MAG: hypothetical protein ACLP5E_16140 [Streptosporangiaceae bacterium]